MKINGKNLFNQKLRQTLASLALCSVLALPTAATAQKMSRPQPKKQAAIAVKPLTEEQKILHVLNRLAYGARPGDVEKVRQIGIERYVEAQLNPAKIDDAVAESKVKNLEVLQLSNAELFAQYPNPAAVLQILAREQGVSAKELRADLKQDRKEMKNAANGEAMKNENQPANPADLSAQERREYQRRIAEIYRENDLRRPQQITQQLNASRILRAVYSERQLNEKLVDFWTNHINVYV